MDDRKCARPGCGHTESQHRQIDIFFYECLVESCDCRQFCYYWPGRDYRAEGVISKREG